MPFSRQTSRAVSRQDKTNVTVTAQAAFKNKVKALPDDRLLCNAMTRHLARWRQTFRYNTPPLTKSFERSEKLRCPQRLKITDHGRVAKSDSPAEKQKVD